MNSRRSKEEFFLYNLNNSFLHDAYQSLLAIWIKYYKKKLYNILSSSDFLAMVGASKNFFQEIY